MPTNSNLLVKYLISSLVLIDRLIHARITLSSVSKVTRT